MSPAGVPKITRKIFRNDIICSILYTYENLQPCKIVSFKIEEKSREEENRNRKMKKIKTHETITKDNYVAPYNYRQKKKKEKKNFVNK